MSTPVETLFEDLAPEGLVVLEIDDSFLRPGKKIEMRRWESYRDGQDRLKKPDLFTTLGKGQADRLISWMLRSGYRIGVRHGHASKQRVSKLIESHTRTREVGQGE